MRYYDSLRKTDAVCLYGGEKKGREEKSESVNVVSSLRKKKKEKKILTKRFWRLILPLHFSKFIIYLKAGGESMSIVQSQW